MSLNSTTGNFTAKSLVFPVLIVLLIASSFIIGVLWTKVKFLEKNATTESGAGSTENTAQQANQQAQAPTADLATIKGVFDKNVVKFGDKNKKVLFIEIADPSCPYCHIAGGKNPELAKEVGTRFQYKTNGGAYLPPVTEMKKLVDQGKAAYAFLYSDGHGNGEMGAKAMYCAADQGKFWQAHDLLYTNAGYDLLNNTVKNDKSKSGTLADFLKGALDAGKLKSCLDEGKYDSRISDEQALSTSLGAQGTPGFFVNSTIFRGAYSFADMQSVVDTALKN